MRRTTCHLVKVLVLTGVIVGLAAAILPSDLSRSPYLSALSSLASAPEAAAATSCTDRVCDSTGTRCVHVHGSHYDCARGDFCRERACL